MPAWYSGPPLVILSRHTTDYKRTIVTKYTYYLTTYYLILSPNPLLEMDFNTGEYIKEVDWPETQNNRPPQDLNRLYI